MERVGTMEASLPTMQEPPPSIVEESEPEQPSQEEVKTEAEDKPRDPNAPLYEGGPTWRSVEAWKAQYGDVFVTAIAEEKYVIWRTLTRSEYRRLVRALEQAVAAGKVTQAEANLDNEEAISQVCILHPKLDQNDMNSDMAGIPSIISQQVLEASGFVSVEIRQL